ncbi:MAG: branched-chain amino acid ABC transporter permease [Candidatus Bathyarchaeota archaeon]|nr:branched-chain amino acid ABC transporter permease [Candidatus Bathyarchaeota archaeon]
MIANVALGILGSLPMAIEGNNRLIVDIAMFFGLLVIVAMACNFQYGNAGIPNMGCAVQVIIGAFGVSAVTTRVAFYVVQAAGVKLIPYASDYDWLYNNPINIKMTGVYLSENAITSMGLFFFSIALAMVLGAIVGWLISLPAIRLRATYLMIVLITMADASQILGRNITPIAGGTLGMFVPDVFAWYPGDRGVISAVITLIIGTISFMIFRTMLNSPYGRLMRSIRENEVTVASVGKDVVNIRRNILMFASGITAFAGVMYAFYSGFVIESAYTRSYWTYWPWLMLILGGPGNNAGTFLGCALVIAARRVIQVYKFTIQAIFYFPVSYLEDLLLGAMMVIVMIFRSNGLIPEKLLYIPGVNYSKMVNQDVKVDWRAAPKAGKKKEEK